jgi:hypothetical protein
MQPKTEQTKPGIRSHPKAPMLEYRTVVANRVRSFSCGRLSVAFGIVSVASVTSMIFSPSYTREMGSWICVIGALLAFALGLEAVLLPQDRMLGFIAMALPFASFFLTALIPGL